MTSVTKPRTTSKAKEREQAGLDTVSKSSLAIMGGISAMIGLWAAAAFVGAMFVAGGPFELVKSWFSAITGM